MVDEAPLQRGQRSRCLSGVMRHRAPTCRRKRAQSSEHGAHRRQHAIEPCSPRRAPSSRLVRGSSSITKRAFRLPSAGGARAGCRAASGRRCPCRPELARDCPVAAARPRASCRPEPAQRSSQRSRRASRRRRRSPPGSPRPAPRKAPLPPRRAPEQVGPALHVERGRRSACLARSRSPRRRAAPAIDLARALEEVGAQRDRSGRVGRRRQRKRLGLAPLLEPEPRQPERQRLLQRQTLGGTASGHAGLAGVVNGLARSPRLAPRASAAASPGHLLHLADPKGEQDVRRRERSRPRGLARTRAVAKAVAAHAPRTSRSDLGPLRRGEVRCAFKRPRERRPRDRRPPAPAPRACKVAAFGVILSSVSSARGRGIGDAPGTVAERHHVCSQ